MDRRRCRFATVAAAARQAERSSDHPWPAVAAAASGQRVLAAAAVAAEPAWLAAVAAAAEPASSSVGAAAGVLSTPAAGSRDPLDLRCLACSLVVIFFCNSVIKKYQN